MVVGGASDGPDGVWNEKKAAQFKEDSLLKLNNPALVREKKGLNRIIISPAGTSLLSLCLLHYSRAMI